MKIKTPSLVCSTVSTVYIVKLTSRFACFRTNHIHSMAWDDTGRRVAVLFDKADARHNLVAVFSTSYVPLFQIVPM